MGDIPQRYRGWPVHNIVIRHGLSITFHAGTKNTLAHKINSTHHKNCKNNPNNRANGVGRGWRWFFCRIAAQFIRAVTTVSLVVAPPMFADALSTAAVKLVWCADFIAVLLIRLVLAICIAITSS